MDKKLSWKLRLVADHLEAMHGRAFAEAFLEDYYAAKIAQSERKRENNTHVDGADHKGEKNFK